MEQTITPFSILLSRIQAGEGASMLDVPEDWLQGRTLFGGLQAVVGLAAMRSLAPAAPLRSLQVTFLAPVPGGPVHARARILRSGKNATHVEARIVDGDNTLAFMVGVFGLQRPSAVTLRPQQPEVTPENPFEMRWIPGVTPNFTQHFKARWIAGGPPWSGIERPGNVIELGMRDQGNATESHVVAMADFIPPIALSYLKKPVAAASLTWMLELLGEEVSTLPLEGWRLDAMMTAAHSGYINQSLVLWGPGGVPVALGRQTMVVFG
ncbi:MAG TPA: thioesterase family protein [Usitatibacter sp.]|nr:thioesterase family protein [Usitatibacter sp.]